MKEMESRQVLFLLGNTPSKACLGCRVVNGETGRPFTHSNCVCFGAMAAAT